MAIIHGTGILWNPRTGRRAAEFINRQIITTDPEIIRLAKLNGLKIEGLEEVKEQKQPELEIEVKREVKQDPIPEEKTEDEDDSRLHIYRKKGKK